MAVNLGQRIKDLVGFDFESNTMNTENEGIKTACAEVIDRLPSDYLLKYAVSPTTITTTNPDSTFDATGKRILRVLRADNSVAIYSVYRICEYVDIDTFKELDDSDSIYAPTNHSPVYTIDSINSDYNYLKVLPTISSGTENALVYYIEYPSNIAMYTLESIDGLPHEVEHAIALKASIYILQVLISDTVQDEEDDEMLQMQQAQMQSLTSMYDIEMQRLTNNPEGDATD
tara:strand:+ start:281 stop:970 length:690 start_codon:yes stop_codon:yes gene_type:complete